jgi:hypothetical protein
VEEQALAKLVNYLGGGAELIAKIVSWNDTRGRTKEEVVATLRAAVRS